MYEYFHAVLGFYNTAGAGDRLKERTHKPTPKYTLMAEQRSKLNGR